MGNKDCFCDYGIRVNTYKDNFETDTFQTVSVKSIKGFKEEVLDVDFFGVEVICFMDMTDRKISLTTIVDWVSEIKRIDGYVHPDIPYILGEVDEEEDDSEELKKKKS